MSDLNGVRIRAIDLARKRADGDAGLLEMRPQLENDAEMWPIVWAPTLALALHRTGDPEQAWGLLEAATAAGFHQPEQFELAELFSADPRWPDLLQRMRANVPPPPIELLDWPDPAPSLPLILFRAAPEREAILRERLPRPQASAWATAVQTLRWVHTRWVHTSSNHAPGADAVTILDRVAAGERFACLEYTTTLCQSLNALGIPSRNVGVRIAAHHTGFGTSHRVSEAWIDDLGRWVLLDGQNGAVWTDGGLDGALGTLELHRRFVDGGPQPRLAGLVKEFDQPATDEWWSYFARFATTGASFGASYVPFLEGNFLLPADRLVRGTESAYPALAQVAIGIAGTADVPTITFSAAHPYAQGFAVTAGGKRSEVEREWPIDRTPGPHEVAVAIRTGYGEFPAGTVTYRVP